MTERFTLIPIKDIQTNPYQPRQQFDLDKLEELAKSIGEHGIIQPLIVRPSSILGYELMAGERRLRASQLAGLDQVPVLIRNLTDQEMMSQAIIENLQRKDLSPIEEARAYQRLIDKGNTHEMIAKTMGKSRPYISNSVRLLQLSNQVLEALDKELISQAHARTLLAFDKAETQEYWLQKIISDQLSVRQLEAIVTQKHKKKKVKPKSIFTKNLEEDLSRHFGTPVTISETKQGSGQITIAFSSLEELDRLIHNLK